MTFWPTQHAVYLGARAPLGRNCISLIPELEQEWLPPSSILQPLRLQGDGERILNHLLETLGENSRTNLAKLWLALTSGSQTVELWLPRELWNPCRKLTLSIQHIGL